MELKSEETATVEKLDFGTGTTKKVSSVNEIDDFLSGYKGSMTVDNPPEGKPLGQQPTSPPQQTNSNVDPWGNPIQYYRRGAKKGQPKPFVAPTNNFGQPLPPKTPPIQPQQTHTVGGELLTGALFLLLVDMLMPNLIALINNWVSKDKVDAKHLKLTDSQKDELAPIADRVVKHINLDQHPIALYVLCTFAMYSMRLLAARMEIDLKTDKKPVKNLWS